MTGVQTPVAGVDANAAPVTELQTPVAGVDADSAPKDPGFLERGGLRRRLRFLRKTRELAYRDLGGLVFEMHRLGQQREDLLAGKLATLQRIDTELRTIEDTLHQRHGVTVLREAGVTACPRCAAIHGSEDRFCPACGFSMGTNSERPIGSSAVATPAGAPAAPAPGNTGAQQTPPAGAPRPSPPSPPAGSRSPAGPPSRANPPGPPPTRANPSASPPSRANPPARPPSSADQPTQAIEPPTQIVRPSRDEPPAEKSNRA